MLKIVQKIVFWGSISCVSSAYAQEKTDFVEIIGSFRVAPTDSRLTMDMIACHIAFNEAPIPEGTAGPYTLRYTDINGASQVVPVRISGIPPSFEGPSNVAALPTVLFAQIHTALPPGSVQLMNEGEVVWESSYTVFDPQVGTVVTQPDPKSLKILDPRIFHLKISVDAGGTWLAYTRPDERKTEWIIQLPPTAYFEGKPVLFSFVIKDDPPGRMRFKRFDLVLPPLPTW